MNRFSNIFLWLSLKYLQQFSFTPSLNLHIESKSILCLLQGYCSAEVNFLTILSYCRLFGWCCSVKEWTNIMKITCFDTYSCIRDTWDCLLSFPRHSEHLVKFEIIFCQNINLWWLKSIRWIMKNVPSKLQSKLHSLGPGHSWESRNFVIIILKS